MLRQSPHPLLVASFCCALCLTVGAFPAEALPIFESERASRFDAKAWLERFWLGLGSPVVSLFAADEEESPAPTPPTSNSGIVIDPDGPRI